jgi:transcriptional regulator with XRE-family HTH domain
MSSPELSTGPTLVPGPDGGLLVARSQEEKETAGQRITRLRKERGITQTELAERVGVTQPMISGWERGDLRLHGELITQLCQIFGVSADEILGLQPSPPSPASPARRRLSRRLQEIDKLPRRDQEALLRTIDAFLGKAS